MDVLLDANYQTEDDRPVIELFYRSDSKEDKKIKEIRDFEPRIALSGGDDGLDKICQLLSQAKHKLLPGGLVLLEIGQGQADAVAYMARCHFHNAQIDLIPDFGGIKRVVRVLS